MKTGVSLLLGALVAGFVLASKRSSSSAPVERKCPLPGSRVLLIGDSLGVGLDPYLAKHALECQAITYASDVFVRAHVTEFTEARMAALLVLKPTHVMISLGGNDFGRTDPQHVKESIDRLVFQIRQAGSLPLWIEPPFMPHDDAQVRAWWRDSGLGSYFAVPTVAGLEQHRAPDKIHYTPKGYELLAAMLWKWISQFMQAAPP